MTIIKENNLMNNNNIRELNITYLMPVEHVINEIKRRKADLVAQGYKKVLFFTTVNGSGRVTYNLKGIK